MVAPARACVYRSKRPMGSRFAPRERSMTILSIVAIVTIPKTPVTSTRPKVLLLAAGYISSGIRGSQGPNTKMVKSIQGVRFFAFSPLWTCNCSLVLCLCLCLWIGILTSPCACQCTCGRFFRAVNTPQINYPSPKAISNHAANPPRNDSIAPNLFKEIPRAIPIIPNTTELSTWPIPHKAVINVVLANDHCLARAITIKGR